MIDDRVDDDEPTNAPEAIVCELILRQRVPMQRAHSSTVCIEQQRRREKEQQRPARGELRAGNVVVCFVAPRFLADLGIGGGKGGGGGGIDDASFVVVVVVAAVAAADGAIERVRG